MISKTFKNNNSISKTAKLLNLSYTTVYNYLIKHNIITRKPSRQTILNSLQETASITETAKQLNLSLPTIYNAIKTPTTKPERPSKNTIITLYQQTRSIKHTAKMTGVSTTYVSKIIKDIDKDHRYIHTSTRQNWLPEYEDGQSIKQIASRYNVPYHAVHSYLYNLGIDLSDNRWRGKTKPTITPKRKRTWLEEYNTGKSIDTIAKENNTTRQAVYLHLRRKGAHTNSRKPLTKPEIALLEEGGISGLILKKLKVKDRDEALEKAIGMGVI